MFLFTQKLLPSRVGVRMHFSNGFSFFWAARRKCAQAARIEKTNGIC